MLWLGVAPGPDARLGARRRFDPAAVTFSIVGCDIPAEAWGVAVAAHSLAIGAVVPWTSVGVGAVATQALTNVTYGPHGLVADRLRLERARVARSADRGRPRQGRAAGRHRRRPRALGEPHGPVLPALGRRSFGSRLRGAGRSAGRAGRDRRDGPELRGERGAARPSPARRAARGRPRGRRSPRPPVGGAARRHARRGLRRLGERAARPAHRRPPAPDRRAGAAARPVRGAHRARRRPRRGSRSRPSCSRSCARCSCAPGTCCPRASRASTAALRTWVAGENLGMRWWDEDTLDPVVLERLRAAADAASVRLGSLRRPRRTARRSRAPRPSRADRRSRPTATRRRAPAAGARCTARTSRARGRA